MEKAQLIRALNEMGWQGAGPDWNGWEISELQEVYRMSVRAERMAIDSEDR